MTVNVTVSIRAAKEPTTLRVNHWDFPELLLLSPVTKREFLLRGVYPSTNFAKVGTSSKFAVEAPFFIF
jgi:hypothetical protein